MVPSMRYCDNGGCNRRRVVTSKTSLDGLNWSNDGPFITPDEQDPPELEFYRIRPFYIGQVRQYMHVNSPQKDDKCDHQLTFASLDAFLCVYLVRHDFADLLVDLSHRSACVKLRNTAASVYCRYELWPATHDV